MYTRVVVNARSLLAIHCDPLCLRSIPQQVVPLGIGIVMQCSAERMSACQNPN